MTDDEMKMSLSLSRREMEVVDAVIGEAARGLKYDGIVGGVDGVEADVDTEDESRGGDEMEIAEAMDCDMSERRSDARFWLLEKLYILDSRQWRGKGRNKQTYLDPRCSSSHFLPTLPTHEETAGGDAAATASDPKPGMDDMGGNADPFMVALFVLVDSRFRPEGETERDDADSIGEKILSSGLELSLDLRRCIFVLLFMELEGKQSGSVSKLE
jgi:hypothetical protein